MSYAKFREFVELIHSIRDIDLLEDFLMGCTTEKERAELTKRLAIVRHLLAGKPQQKIARDLKVGVATVTRGSKELVNGTFRVLRERV